MAATRECALNMRTLEHRVQQAARLAADATQSETAPTADAASEVLVTALATASRTTTETGTAADVRTISGTTPTAPEPTQTYTLTAAPSFPSRTTPVAIYTRASTASRVPKTTGATFTGASAAAP